MSHSTPQQVSDTRTAVRALFNALDFLKPIEFDIESERKKYVAGLHGDIDAVAHLKENLDLAQGQGVFLFTGQSGTGKSSELKRLKNELSAEANCKVFYLDLEDWLNPSSEIDIHSFLLAIASAWTLEIAGENGADRGYITRLSELLTKTDIGIDKITLETSVLSIKANLSLFFKSRDTLAKSMENTARSYSDSIIKQVHAYVSETVANLVGKQGKCILLIDSLEKIRSTAANAEAVYLSIQNLFTLNVSALKLPSTHVVYSISPVVLEQNKQLPVNLGGAVAVYLPSVHIYKNQACEEDTVCFEKIQQLLTLRDSNWTVAFTVDQVRQAIHATGGDLRDFLRVLQAALTARKDKSSLTVDDAALAFALEQVCPSLDIPIEDMLWLQAVSDSRSSSLGGKHGFLQLAQYLGTKHIQYYRNGQTWYNINPQIRSRIKSRTDQHLAKQAASIAK